MIEAYTCNSCGIILPEGHTFDVSDGCPFCHAKKQEEDSQVAIDVGTVLRLLAHEILEDLEVLKTEGFTIPEYQESKKATCCKCGSNDFVRVEPAKGDHAFPDMAWLKCSGCGDTNCYPKQRS